MIQIIEKISKDKGIQFTLEESTMFIGNMSVPVKNYKLSYPVELGQIQLTGEFRRSHWKNKSLLKDIHLTDIYLWSIELKSIDNLPKFKIERSSWFNTFFWNQEQLRIQCKNERLRNALSEIKELYDLLVGNKETVSASIKAKNNSIWANFNTTISHEQKINEALIIFEKISFAIKNNS